MNFKDLFSGHAGDYAKFRPTYPPALFEYLASLAPHHEKAWDCGAGNGQASIGLTGFFREVIASDPSAEQIAKLPRHSNLTGRVGTAENSDFDDETVDLVTAAQAFHWFRADAFFAEVKRVLKPRGVLAFWCYGLCEISPEVDKIVYHLYEDILGPCWEPERRVVEGGYQNVTLPFTEIKTPEFHMDGSWELPQLVGYLSTWSALKTFIKQQGQNPLEELFPRLAEAWGTPGPRPVKWNLSVRAGQKD